MKYQLIKKLCNLPQAILRLVYGVPIIWVLYDFLPHTLTGNYLHNPLILFSWI